MDEETFDVARVRQCPVGVREPDGRNIPSCSYNVLYRERDARFMSAPEAPLVVLGGRAGVHGARIGTDPVAKLPRAPCEPTRP